MLFACASIAGDRQAAQHVEGPTSDAALNALVPTHATAAAFASSHKVSSFEGAVPATARERNEAKLRVRNIGRDTHDGAQAPNAAGDAAAIPARPSGNAMPEAFLSFDGLSNFDNIDAYTAVILPPDMIGDVGPAHYVQAVNALVRIYDKSGGALTPPFKMSQLFAPLGTPCSSRDDGEPVVLYDPLADRWLLSQYCNNFPPYRQMIAISKTGDPTGDYHLYEFVMPNNRINDLAKFGVWTDGYYMSTEEFTGADFTHMGAFAFDRTRMLAGDPAAAYIYFARPATTAPDRLGNLLPADLDGLRPPPAGAPNVFIGYTATEYGDVQDALLLFDFHADFAEPAASTFIERPESPLAVAAFDPTSPPGRTDITQPAPGDKLDANSDRLNYRAAYRNLGDTESIVLNQTVRMASDPYRAGVRLYELRRTGAEFAVAEQSTIGDAVSSRWIGSAAQDHQGNIAVGYNFVTDIKQPSIRYAGRLAGDPAGTIRNEATLIDGTGVQKAFGWRWGDYSGMAVDPTDDCTFWMTGEYYTLASEQFSDFTWLTRIGPFRFAECTPAPRAAVTGTVTNALTGLPVAGATVTATAYSRSTGAGGSYGTLAVIPGAYTITASAAGYAPQSVTIEPANGQTFMQNFVLDPIPVFENVAVDLSAESCGTNGSPDPGETVTVSVALRNTGQLPTTRLTAALIESGGVTMPSSPQNYGPLPVGGPPVSREFTFTVDPSAVCGSRITMTFQLTDGEETLGVVTTALQTGTPKIAFKEDFDRTHQGQLPIRWLRSTANAQGQPDATRNWRVSAARSASSSKAAFSPAPHQRGLNEMVSPVFAINTTAARVTFSNWYELETTFLRNRLYDGSVLEIGMGDGEFVDILDAGGVFESGGYDDGLIDSCCQNPLAGRRGWSGRSGTGQTPVFITTSVKLPPSAAGHLVRLRWRVGTDIGGFREGQYIDNLRVTDGFECGCTAPR